MLRIVINNMFLGVETVKLLCCSCSPAPNQLIRVGLFPCAPIAPSLAVDLQLLDFVKSLYVRQSPNITAWCDALESSLIRKGFNIKMNTLRRRFSNAYHWFCVLVMKNEDHISKLICDVRDISTGPARVGDDDEGLARPSDYLRGRCALCFGSDDFTQARKEGEP